MSKQKFREFKITTAALKNRNTVFLLTALIIFFGIFSYRNLPKELFPEIVLPTVLVQTTYPGNPPLDIENLITRPLEKEIESVTGIKEISSTSAQDASMIIVEFNTDVDIKVALQDVKDAVDKAKSELPGDLLFDPLVQDIDFSEFPIININLSGVFSVEELKNYAEILEERIESVGEISKVEIRGVDEREIKVDVDLLKMESYGLSFDDIEFAISQENVSISGGEIKLGDTRRSVRTVGEFEDVKELENIIVKREGEVVVYLKNVATVTDGYEEPKTFTRLDNQSVVSVQVIKKSGENLLEATDQIFAIIDQAEASGDLPPEMTVTLTNDQSEMIRMQLSNLENSMIMGVIFVILVLFYFLGTRNALFVGLAIPMSMFLSFIILNALGFKVNLIVLFALILALGLLVDNAIVVVENIYRFVDRGFGPYEAARRAVGEIAYPIITSTSTTLAAFLPLAFWGGVTGEFMKNLPITLIIVLTSSLFVALIIVPVFSATFIRMGPDRKNNMPNVKRGLIIALSFIGAGGLFYIPGWNAIATLAIIFGIIGLLNALFFHKAEDWFQNVFLDWLDGVYSRFLRFALRKWNPVFFFIGTFILLIFAIGFFQARDVNVVFFPDNEPSYINIVAELPIGTDVTATNNFMKELESDVNGIIEPYRDIVKSVLTTVGVGNDQFEAGNNPNEALTTVSFVEYELRDGIETSKIQRELTDHLLNRYPGVVLSIEKDRMGPPAGDPVSIEIAGDDFEQIIMLTDSVLHRIDEAGIMGLEGLTMDLDLGKPELLVKLDRDKLMRYGLSTYQVANTLRTALFGREVSDFKVGEEEYPINMRLKEEYRYNSSTLLNMGISYVDNGQLINIPLSALADVEYRSTYGAVKRKDLRRVITLSSNVIEGYNATRINQQLAGVLEAYDFPEGYTYEFGGEQEEQRESMAFLINALLIAVAIILMILVTQFNSIVKPAIILASVLFSTIGVFGGIATFRMDFVVVMTGIGIVSLAGIVVNNAIVLIDYIELLKKAKRRELGLREGEFLPVHHATDTIIEGGRTRLRPVLLTAITTILGLIPLAVGLNIDFGGLLRELKPNIFFGGDMVIFWGPISWTVIFGLTFATFLTLVIVPVMYKITVQISKMINTRMIRLRRIENGETVEE
ncbi:MAG: efflux RND transporter permease subunit [Bacteroidales bacterium]|nr:efflux RND transporter permease subunit [Bacteroidales bacterium]